MKNKCDVEGCQKLVESGGLCSMHRKRRFRHGDVDAVLQVHDPDRPCLVKGCTNKHKAFDYCEVHYKEFGKQEVATRFCSVVGCGRVHSAKGLCANHYLAEYNKYLRRLRHYVLGKETPTKDLLKTIESVSYELSKKDQK